jgi:hypothetical protein
MRLWVTMAVAVMLAGTQGNASAGLVPSDRTVTVRAGKTATAHFTVDANVPVDVALVFDTTASLGEMLAEAGGEAGRVVQEIQSHVPDAQFAVAQFKDKGDSPEYRVEQAMTGSASKISAAVGRLTSRGGGDLPEAYNLAFTKSFTPASGGNLGWRTFSRKIVVVLGDAEPHGAGAAGIEGCEDTSADPQGLNTAAVLSDLVAADRTLVMVHLMDHHAMVMGQPPASFECYQGLAKAAGGVAVEGHGDELGHSIIHAVTSVIPVPDPDAELELSVVRAWPAPASRKWLDVSEAVMPAGADDGAGQDDAAGHDAGMGHDDGANFDVSISPPRRTTPGIYRFKCVARANGVVVGQATITVKVVAKNAGHMSHH